MWGKGNKSREMQKKEGLQRPGCFNHNCCLQKGMCRRLEEEDSI